MDLLEAPWTPERLIAWDDLQDQKHESDGARVIDMAGGSRGHQRIGLNLAMLLIARLDLARFDVIQGMRLTMGRSVRYPDMVVTPAPLEAKCAS